MMTRNFVFALLAIIALSAGAYGQKKELSTVADPFGLKIVGLGERVKAYSIVPVAPADDVPQPYPHQSCGEGVSYRISRIPTPRGPKEIKIVVLTYKPEFDGVDTPKFDKGTPAEPPEREYRPPVGYGSISFGWPPQLRTDQFVRLQWTGTTEDGQVHENWMELWAEISLREGDKQSISWKLDSFVSPVPSAQIVGKRIESDPLLFYITLTKAAKKCLSK